MTWPSPVLAGAPRIGLGLAALGRPAYLTTGRPGELGGHRDVASMRERTATVLDAAVAAGIRYIDAARSYGLAEEFLTSWLTSRGVRPGEVAVGSKWGYRYVGDWRMDADRHEVQDLGVAAFRRQLVETRSLLGEHLDLYQVHSATLQNGVLRDADVLAALRAERDDGLAIGFTATGPDQAGTIDAAVELDLFDSVQATWNILEPSSGDALWRAHRAGLFVIVKEAVANGRLTSAGDQPALAAAATERGLSLDALAISAALAQPWAGMVLSGAVSVDMLRSNLTADAALWDADVASFAAALAETPASYWQARSQRSWT